MRIMGCWVFLMVSRIVLMPPLSTFPWMWSASSRMISFLPPESDRRNSPLSVKVWFSAPAVATRRMASAFRVSDAFSSMTPQPMSEARAWAAVVFPQPGFPARMTARFLGSLPDSQARAQVRSDCTAFLLPTTSSKVRGLYFSVHSTLFPFPKHRPG